MEVLKWYIPFQEVSENLNSFFIKLKKSDGSLEKLKMEFCIVELLDSRVILGIISKKK